MPKIVKIREIPYILVNFQHKNDKKMLSVSLVYPRKHLKTTNKFKNVRKKDIFDSFLAWFFGPTA